MAVQSNLAWLVVVGVVASVVSAAYYIRPVKAMFVDAPSEAEAEAAPTAPDAAPITTAPDQPSWGGWPLSPLGATLALTLAGIIVIGLAPSLLIDVAAEAVASMTF